MFLIYGGIGLAAQSPWVLMITVPLAIIIRYGVVAREEAYLERRFGDAYRDDKAPCTPLAVGVNQQRRPCGAPVRHIRETQMRSGADSDGALAIVLSTCAMPTPQEANDAVLMLRNYESWAWAAGIALIWTDLVLPIPQTAVSRRSASSTGHGSVDCWEFRVITGGLLG